MQEAKKKSQSSPNTKPNVTDPNKPGLDPGKVKPTYYGMKPGTIVLWETGYRGRNKGFKTKVLTDSTGEIYPGNKPATDTIKYKW